MSSAKPNALHFALREMQTLARTPLTWIMLAVIGVLLGMVGPFGTFALPIGPRLAYWAVIVVVTSTVGTLTEMIVVGLLLDRVPPGLSTVIGGAIGGIPIAASVWGINLLAYGLNTEAIPFWTLLAYCVPIAAMITGLGSRVRRSAAGPDASTEWPANRAPALLERLPLPQRGRLLHLAVNDHYVDVTTDKGTSLILIRLSDAMREVAPTQGLQVHRSHWVALDAVRRGRRQDGKPVLELENGTVVPVSRTYLAEVKQAGLLS